PAGGDVPEHLVSAQGDPTAAPPGASVRHHVALAPSGAPAIRWRKFRLPRDSSWISIPHATGMPGKYCPAAPAPASNLHVRPGLSPNSDRAPILLTPIPEALAPNPRRPLGAGIGRFRRRAAGRELHPGRPAPRWTSGRWPPGGHRNDSGVRGILFPPEEGKR